MAVEIPDWQLSNLREIYRDPIGKTVIYFGDYSAPSSAPIPVAIKKIRCSGMHESYIYLGEINNQMRIDSENICKIFGWNMTSEQISIVMERLDNDLAKEIMMRREQSYPYTEVDLLRMLWDTVNVFAEMQLLSLSHNDIKAENIFVKKRNSTITYKVGDFGSATTVRSLVNGLKGTPLYLSPILKREYHRASYGQPIRQDILHNPIKSDVFSLGVTLIFAAEMQAPNDLLDGANLEGKLGAHQQKIGAIYPVVGWVLERMLAVDETRRWDFTTIRSSLLSLQQLRDYAISPNAPSFHRANPQATLSTLSQRDYVAFLNENLGKRSWENVETALEILDGQMGLAALDVEAEWRTTECVHCIAQILIPEKLCKNCGMPKGQVSY